MPASVLSSAAAIPGDSRPAQRVGSASRPIRLSMQPCRSRISVVVSFTGLLSGKRRVDRREEGILAERFSQERQRRTARRLAPRGGIVVGTDEGGREVSARGTQSPLQLEAAHARHAYVDDQ